MNYSWTFQKSIRHCANNIQYANRIRMINQNCNAIYQWWIQQGFFKEVLGEQSITLNPALASSVLIKVHLVISWLQWYSRNAPLLQCQRILKTRTPRAFCIGSVQAVTPRNGRMRPSLAWSRSLVLRTGTARLRMSLTAKDHGAVRAIKLTNGGRLISVINDPFYHQLILYR